MFAFVMDAKSIALLLAGRECITRMLIQAQINKRGEPTTSYRLAK